MLRKSAENPAFSARVSFFCPRLRFFTQDRPFCMARELILATKRRATIDRSCIARRLDVRFSRYPHRRRRHPHRNCVTRPHTYLERHCLLLRVGRWRRRCRFFRRQLALHCSEREVPGRGGALLTLLAHNGHWYQHLASTLTRPDSV